MAAKKTKKETTVKIEREFNVPLKKAFERTKAKRANKAVNLLKKFMKKNFRISEEKILVSNLVNEEIWKHGMAHIPRRIKVKAVLEGEILRVLLPKEKMPEKKEKKKKEEKTKEETEKEKEMEKKKEEKKEMEKEAEAVAIKRGQ